MSVVLPAQDGNKTAIDDSTLCSNKSFWDNVTHHVGNDYYNKTVKLGLGIRCTSQMGTIYPWYKIMDGKSLPRLKQNCDDRSDRVFNATEPCPNRNHYLDIHNREWCSTKPASDLPICRNRTAWLETKRPRLDDPHYCQESCATPGLNCEACSGKNVSNVY